VGASGFGGASFVLLFGHFGGVMVRSLILILIEMFLLFLLFLLLLLLLLLLLFERERTNN